MRSPSSADPTHRRLRLISVLAATAIALSCGTNYAYSAWSPQFASRLNLSSTSTNLIGNAGNIGMYAMGIPGGILIDAKGPRWGVLLGGLALAAGYFPLRAAYIAGSGSVPVLCLFGLLTGVGSCTAFSAAIKVSATNWPARRGTATAFPLSAFGLSAFFYTAVAGGLFPDDTAGYLLLLACGTTVMVLGGMVFLQMVPTASSSAVPTDERPTVARRDSNRLRRTSMHSRHSSKGSTIDMGKSLLADTFPFISRPNRSDNTAMLSDNPSETSSLVSSGPGDLDDEPKHHPTNPSPQYQADTLVNSSNGSTGVEVTGWPLLRTSKFWLLFILLGLLCGVGLMTINNIGNNARTLWHHFDDTASHDFIQQRQFLHVSLLSLCSFVGRLASGIGSDFLLHHHLSRFWTLVASAILFACAQALALVLENPNALFWLSGLTGLAYGALFGVYPALVADAFGSKGMGINWGAMTMAPVLSGNVFNLVYGWVLDRHSHFEGDGKGGGERVCPDGRSCYAPAYMVTLVASLIGVGWALMCISREGLERKREGGEGREHEG
ncbi:hypothetical protein M433DRAFT_147192 [Acidomyces richmondensis BFW]|nr:hypothetical protein M433DRAFT_147192 [Acidomyces richmondensis BFW]